MPIRCVTYEKAGMPGKLVGMHDPSTGKTRPLTQAAVDLFIAKFEGKQYLTQPFLVEYSEVAA